MMENSRNSLKEHQWTTLLAEIDKGNVVPIIGSELFNIEIDGEKIQLEKYIVKKLAESIGVEYNDTLDFTQLGSLKYAYQWNQADMGDMYYLTKEILEKMSNLQVKSSESLRKLMEIKKFKLVLTTTFDDWVFKIMKEVWDKEEVKSFFYDNSPIEKYTKEEIVNHPTIYHMLGKASHVKNSFVLTEDDLLIFLQNWLNFNYRPRKLVEILSDKYLLVIGCNYPNWLFRFFIQSFKSVNARNQDSELMIGVADSKLDQNLVAFLSRVKAQVHDNATMFIDELVNRWKEYPHKTENDDVDKDIFISYAREDLEMVSKIRDAMEEEGASVWLDKRELEPGDEYEAVIMQRINKCKAFVPILSESAISRDVRYLFKEWRWGQSAAENRSFNRAFIYPIFIDSVNIQDGKIPDSFKQREMINFNNSDFRKRIKDLVRKMRG